jgi:uncharacterized membrane protein
VRAGRGEACVLCAGLVAKVTSVVASVAGATSLFFSSITLSVFSTLLSVLVAGDLLLEDLGAIVWIDDCGRGCQSVPLILEKVDRKRFFDFLSLQWPVCCGALFLTFMYPIKR